MWFIIIHQIILLYKFVISSSNSNNVCNADGLLTQFSMGYWGYLRYRYAIRTSDWFTGFPVTQFLLRYIFTYALCTNSYTCDQCCLKQGMYGLVSHASRLDLYQKFKAGIHCEQISGTDERPLYALALRFHWTLSILRGGLGSIWMRRLTVRSRTIKYYKSCSNQYRFAKYKCSIP